LIANAFQQRAGFHTKPAAFEKSLRLIEIGKIIGTKIAAERCELAFAIGVTLLLRPAFQMDVRRNPPSSVVSKYFVHMGRKLRLLLERKIAKQSFRRNRNGVAGNERGAASQ